ncbi:hypothetical protein IFM89_016399 [Coptis chinensis]|uniref:Uncharacterized protein n=1 Tax=Coptis chinensis TaxID=261450 RepID=A0A835HFP0_9MAGN|nr:hypothetical protein IFM89_016399 [Coptis chinensis]
MMRSGTKIQMNASEMQEKEAITRMEPDKKANDKPSFKPAEDDTKPILRDPILRSDPIETEQVFLRLPPFPSVPVSEPHPHRSM